MADFKLTRGSGVIHTPTGRIIHPGKTVAWRRYLEWKAEGNTPDPADPPGVPVDALIEMRDLIDTAGNALNDATSLGEAKLAILDLFKALLGRHPGQTTTMAVREKR